MIKNTTIYNQIVKVIGDTNKHLFLINAYIPPRSKAVDRETATKDLDQTLNSLYSRYSDFSVYIYADMNIDLRQKVNHKSDIGRISNKHNLETHWDHISDAYTWSKSKKPSNRQRDYLDFILTKNVDVK